MKTTLLLAVFAMWASHAVGSDERFAPQVELAKGLAPDEMLGRQIRIPYSTFVDRLVLQRAERKALQTASEIGATRIIVLGPTSHVPTRRKIFSRGYGSISGHYEGELIAYEVIKKTS